MKCFVTRKSDGKFLRGSIFFTWVKSWRYACLVTPDYVDQMIAIGGFLEYGISSHDEIELWTFQRPLTNRGY